MAHKIILPRKYLYDGIQNIQFEDNNPIVYLRDVGSRVYFDTKFTASGSYNIYANINFENNPFVVLQTGVIYPGEIQSPIKLTNKKIMRPKNNIYVFIGRIHINNVGINSLFINNVRKLEYNISVNHIKITGKNELQLPYTEWWNKETNAGKRPYQHANHIVSNSIFDIQNPRHMYREITVLKWHIHTYATAINGPSTYMGIDFSENKIVFSVWNAVVDNITIPNKIIFVGENIVSNAFDHEGNGSYFALKHELKLNNKYGFYIRYDENKTVDENKTTYSGYFIDLGPIDSPYTEPKWILIGKVDHYNSYVIQNRIGGFLENYMTANGHLFKRQVVIGNGWVSPDGINWTASNHEEAVMDDLYNQCAYIYNDSNITYCIGGRVGMKDENLIHHGNLHTFDIYRNPENYVKPAHLDLLKLI